MSRASEYEKSFLHYKNDEFLDEIFSTLSMAIQTYSYILINCNTCTVQYNFADYAYPSFHDSLEFDCIKELYVVWCGVIASVSYIYVHIPHEEK